MSVGEVGVGLLGFEAFFLLEGFDGSFGFFAGVLFLGFGGFDGVGGMFEV